VVTVTYDVTGLANAAAAKASLPKGLFMCILRALQISRAREARRVIVTHAHLLPEGVRPANVIPFIATDQVNFW